MLVWGGFNAGVALGTGGRYNALAASWSPLSSVNSPSARSSHTAVRTGSSMIVWGGGTSSTTKAGGGEYVRSVDGERMRCRGPREVVRRSIPGIGSKRGVCRNVLPSM